MTELRPETKPATTERAIRENAASKFQATSFLRKVKLKIRKVKLKHDFSKACMAKYLSE